eukprot:2539700-Prymnesium_polylepis.1
MRLMNFVVWLVTCKPSGRPDDLGRLGAQVRPPGAFVDATRPRFRLVRWRHAAEEPEGHDARYAPRAG